MGVAWQRARARARQW
uniref:Uncharacterized protein n=1 Tax=Arundo donax TaxID=35708 RepID=A0A0A9BA29_ARUDO